MAFNVLEESFLVALGGEGLKGAHGYFRTVIEHMVKSLITQQIFDAADITKAGIITLLTVSEHFLIYPYGQPAFWKI